jgi:hypothetical protein
LEAFRRLLHFFENYDELTRRVKRISKSHGEEGIELLSGQRVRFRTRTAGGGRGFTGDCLFLNEAMILREASMGALYFTLSARPNPQVWYTGSAVDQTVHEHGLVLARVRERALRAEQGLAYWEWASAGALEDVDPDDRDGWARANPAFPGRISEETIEAEKRAVDPKTFAVERLGVGDWPDTNSDDADRITAEAWAACRDPSAKPAALGCVAFDVRPDRSTACIAAAGAAKDGNRFVQVLRHGPGTGWVAKALADIVRDHKPTAVLVDERSPAAALITQIQRAGVELEVVNGTEYAGACAAFFDSVQERTLGTAGNPNSPPRRVAPLGARWGMRGRGHGRAPRWTSALWLLRRWRCVALIVTWSPCTRTGGCWSSPSTEREAHGLLESQQARNSRGYVRADVPVRLAVRRPRDRHRPQRETRDRPDRVGGRAGVRGGVDDLRAGRAAPVEGVPAGRR